MTKKTPVHCLRSTNAWISILQGRPIENYLPLLRKLRNFLVNSSDLLAQTFDRASRNGRSMGCFFSFFPKFLLFALLLHALLRGPACEAARRSCDFVYFAFGEDVVEAGTARLHEDLGRTVELEEELLVIAC